MQFQVAFALFEKFEALHHKAEHAVIQRMQRPCLRFKAPLWQGGIRTQG